MDMEFAAQCREFLFHTRRIRLMDIRQPHQQFRMPGTATRGVPGRDMTDLSKAEMATIVGGVSRQTPDMLTVSGGVAEAWDDGW